MNKGAQAHAGLRTWIEIDRKALAHNYTVMRRVAGKKRQLMAVVKSNAYGHSLLDYSKELERLGADWLGVDSLVEGIALRREGVKTPILVLGYTLPERFLEAAEYNIAIAISSKESLVSLMRCKFTAPLRIHIKTDTGMHRHGFLPEDIPNILKILKKLPSSVQLEGVFTHLAAKDPAVLRTNKEQLRIFDEIAGMFREAGFLPLFHSCASWGTIAYPESASAVARIGMALYGYLPSAHLYAESGKNLKLRPILSWKTIVCEIKILKAGGGVGYDLTEELPAGAKIGICPVGYWHGYPRALSSCGYVVVNGIRARVVGRVSMDIIVIDLSSVPNSKVGDEVVLIGTQKKETVDAREFAVWAGTTHYEALTRINPLIKRIYI